MPLASTSKVMETVQSLVKGGRTTRFTHTVVGLSEKGLDVLPLCFSKPADWVKIPNLKVLEKIRKI